LRARHLSDQAAAARERAGTDVGRGVHVSVVVASYLVVLAFLVSGSYGVAAAAGLVPAVAGSVVSGNG
jgi:hypothetical protein